MNVTHNQQDVFVTSGFPEKIIMKSRVHPNLDQDMIIITEDKVRLCLHTYLKRLEGSRAWIAPASIVVTIVATFASATFHDYILDAATWRAVFILVGLTSIGWLICTIRTALMGHPTIDELVKEMKHVVEQTEAAQQMLRSQQERRTSIQEYGRVQ